MKNNNRKQLILLLTAMICFAAGAATLIPWPYSRSVAVLGYNALCPFSPISTGILFYSGLMINGYRKRKTKTWKTI